MGDHKVFSSNITDEILIQVRARDSFDNNSILNPSFNFNEKNLTFNDCISSLIPEKTSKEQTSILIESKSADSNRVNISNHFTSTTPDFKIYFYQEADHGHFREFIPHSYALKLSCKDHIENNRFKILSHASIM